jgi:FHA domain
MTGCWNIDGECPTLLYVDPNGCSRTVPLGGRELVTLGRRPEADVCLPWDAEISRLHAEIVWRAGEWLITDDGLSVNGTYVNGLPVEGRRRLHDGDLITVGRTNLSFCDPRDPDSDVTLALPDMRPVQMYSEQQQRVLAALCRPLLGDGEGVRPTPDAAIAEALGLPPNVVEHELDAVAHSFDFGSLPTSVRRLRTAVTAIRSGLVTPEGE